MLHIPVKSIKFKIGMTILALMALFGVVFVVFTNIQMKKMAYQEAVRTSRVIMAQNVATHQFINKEQKPTLFDVVGKPKLREKFAPEIMSSNYMVRKINLKLSDLSPFHYYYKEVSKDARKPENEPRGYEKELLERFRKKEIKEYQGIVELNGQKHLVYMKAGEPVEKHCLKCHGDPDKAPRKLIEEYGAEKAFNFKVGEVTYAMSIRIPLELAYAEANRVSLILSLAYGSMLLLIYACMSGVILSFVLRPLKELESKVARMLSQFGGSLESSAPEGDEIGKVSKAFTFLQSKLEKAYGDLEEYARDLEEKVKQRTKELEEANILIREASRNDWLLGILNRGTFEEEARKVFDQARKQQSSLSILMIDYDHFKQYNDMYGHQAGDLALKSVVDVIKDNIRSNDLFGRYGGEELILCLPGITGEQVIEMAGSIVRKVYEMNLIHLGNPPYDRMTVSVGIATRSDSAEIKFESMVKEADENMYRAKEASRNTFFPTEFSEK